MALPSVSPREPHGLQQPPGEGDPPSLPSATPALPNQEQEATQGAAEVRRGGGGEGGREGGRIFACFYTITSLVENHAVTS